MNRSLFLLLALSCTAGCAMNPHRPIDPPVHVEAVERRCGPPAGFLHPISRFGSPDISRPGVQEDDVHTADVALSPEAYAIAETIGVLPLMAQLSALDSEGARNREGSALRFLQFRQQLSDRLLLAFSDVSTASTEAHCEEERASHMADRLQETRDKRVRQDTIYAIIGGSMVGILTGGLDLAGQLTAGAISAIFGGSLEATFGFKAQFESLSHEYRHGVGLLHEVWEGPEHSSRFPTSVWRFLNGPLPNDPEGRSFRDVLLLRWRQDDWLGQAGSDTERRRRTLFFGDGGSYEIEDLRAQAAMLDLLESDIALMAQELHLLMREVLSREAVRYASTMGNEISSTP